MSDRKLFKRVLNSEVTCDYPSPSTWIIKSKRYEKYDQYTSDEAKEIRPSAAIAEFSVENKDNPNQHALMKVFMQMPNLGTEFDLPEERAEQVLGKSPEAIFQTVRALKLFTEKKSTVTSVLLGYKVESQDARGLVPGGFVCYLVWNILPGVRLDDKSDRRPLFWELPRSERDDIRVAFEYTHKQLKEPGIILLLYGLRHLVWNPERKKVYVIGFSDNIPMGEYYPWRNRAYLQWNLAELPGVSWYKSTFDDRDMSGWQL